MALTPKDIESLNAGLLRASKRWDEAQRKARRLYEEWTAANSDESNARNEMFEAMAWACAYVQSGADPNKVLTGPEPSGIPPWRREK
jgi:hypothetical protein